jgi:hypothetical protein
VASDGVKAPQEAFELPASCQVSHLPKPYEKPHMGIPHQVFELGVHEVCELEAPHGLVEAEASDGAIELGPAELGSVLNRLDLDNDTTCVESLVAGEQVAWGDT